MLKNWPDIRLIVEQILRQQRYKNKCGNYNDTTCFLTAYQIAVLVDRQDPSLKGSLPIGGIKTGPNSFAQKIAWHLSKDINDGEFNGNLEIQFLSLNGLEDFNFDGKHTPSDNEFSMFRLRK